MPLMTRLLVFTMIVGGSLLAAQERIPAPDVEAPPLDIEHQLWQEVLDRVASFPEGVDYAQLHREHGDLDTYRAQLARAELPEGRRAQLAFWINAYNAVTLDLVLRTIPDPGEDPAAAWQGFSVLSSVEDFWTAYHYQIAGEWLSIDAIQKEKLAALNEPRIHFAINCASVSCPPLLDQVYTANQLEKQLDQVTRAFVADETQVHIEVTGRRERGRKATLNPLMQWYRDDFGGSDASVRDFLARYASDQRAEDLARADLAYGEYDWNLNDFRKPQE